MDLIEVIHEQGKSKLIDTNQVIYDTIEEFRNPNKYMNRNKRSRESPVKQEGKRSKYKEEMNNNTNESKVAHLVLKFESSKNDTQYQSCDKDFYSSTMDEDLTQITQNQQQRSPGTLLSPDELQES